MNTIIKVLKTLGVMACGAFGLFAIAILLFLGIGLGDLAMLLISIIMGLACFLLPAVIVIAIFVVIYKMF